jgi:predicted RNase H-like nuclease (RuvC/YqgF family)
MIVFELTEWETLTLRAAISQYMLNSPKSDQTCRDILHKAKFEPHNNTRDTHDSGKLDKQLLEALGKALETDERQSKFEPCNNAPNEEMLDKQREALRKAWVERDELRHEVTRLHAQIKQLRARLRRSGWPKWRVPLQRRFRKAGTN